MARTIVATAKTNIAAQISHAGGVRLAVEDDGPGVRDTNNLFVPFFTTKPEGSGIGLVLARQIAEAHGGEVTLGSRPDRAGAVARIRLPIRA